MSLSNYAGLKTSIGAWRFDEGSVLNTYVDDLIALTEARINNGDKDGPFPTPALRCREMMTTATLTLTDGSADLPTGFLEAKRVTVSSASPRLLTYVPLDWYQEAYPSTLADDTAQFYTVIGTTLRSRASSTLELVYYTAIPNLTESASTNWLLTKDPRVYLHGAGMVASILRGDTQRAQEEASMFRGALSGLQESDTFSPAGKFERRASGVAW